MPYPFRYPTPSERRARVKRHRDVARLFLVGGIVLLVGFVIIGDLSGYYVLPGVSIGLGFGILAAHAEED